MALQAVSASSAYSACRFVQGESAFCVLG